MPPNKKQCTRKKGEDESEKAATISTGTHSAVTVSEAWAVRHSLSLLIL